MEATQRLEQQAKQQAQINQVLLQSIEGVKADLKRLEGEIYRHQSHHEIDMRETFSMLRKVVGLVSDTLPSRQAENNGRTLNLQEQGREHRVSQVMAELDSIIDNECPSDAFGSECSEEASAAVTESMASAAHDNLLSAAISSRNSSLASPFARSIPIASPVWSPATNRRIPYSPPLPTSAPLKTMPGIPEAFYSDASNASDDEFEIDVDTGAQVSSEPMVTGLTSTPSSQGHSSERQAAPLDISPIGFASASPQSIHAALAQRPTTPAPMRRANNLAEPAAVAPPIAMTAGPYIHKDTPRPFTRRGNAMPARASGLRSVNAPRPRRATTFQAPEPLAEQGSPMSLSVARDDPKDASAHVINLDEPPETGTTSLNVTNSPTTELKEALVKPRRNAMQSVGNTLDNADPGRPKLRRRVSQAFFNVLQRRRSSEAMPMTHSPVPKAAATVKQRRQFFLLKGRQERMSAEDRAKAAAEVNKVNWV
eukprot:TRINITY_DN9892_c0_g1_i1.p1 TRINITY_DN9892_c0_g1~~TRINITY_DN9892_c0_g1_i1.p1  ORF type:complete len:482 (+),score=124.74 TRINITY_DN9892_c0_g1_i1:1-1446(+)